MQLGAPQGVLQVEELLAQLLEAFLRLLLCHAVRRLGRDLVQADLHDLVSGTAKVWMSAMATSPAMTASMPRATESDFRNATPPRNAGSAARMASGCDVTPPPQARQRTTRPGPSDAFSPRLIAARPQCGHLVTFRSFA